jgi:hypothetical protein
MPRSSPRSSIGAALGCTVRDLIRERQLERDRRHDLEARRGSSAIRCRWCRASLRGFGASNGQKPCQRAKLLPTGEPPSPAADLNRHPLLTIVEVVALRADQLESLRGCYAEARDCGLLDDQQRAEWEGALAHFATPG